jgi:hypothetical protein
MSRHWSLPLFAALLLPVGPAAAQSAPWYVGAVQTFGHDSNIFRLPPGVEQSSGTISATELVGGVDVQPGRQHLIADLRLSHNQYSSQPQLDFNGYTLGAGLDWETVNKLSGAVRLDSSRRLGSFSSYVTPTGNGANIEQYLSLAAEFRLGDYKRSRLWFEGDLSHDDNKNDVDFTNPQPLFGFDGTTGYKRRFKTTGLGLGARYRVEGTLVLGVALHTTRGDEEYTLRPAPTSGDPLADTFRRNDVDFLLAWGATGASRLKARLSYGKTDADKQLFRPDRRGWGGVLTWDWMPTGKLSTNTVLSYETNARSVASDQNTSNEPVASIGLRTNYAATSKLTGHAGLAFRSRQLDRGVANDGTDRRQQYDVGLDWAALRNVTFGCAVSHERRNESSALAAYKATFTSCTVRAVLQ